MELTDRIAAALEPYHALIRAEIPAEAPIVDVHTHLGHDIDGMVGDRAELLGIQERWGIVRSFTFCLDEPDRVPAFTAANDRTLAHAAAAPQTLVPFVRLDLAEQPIEEAVRCLDLGARGIKLHPRAQGFLAHDPRLEPVFELAADRRVPILIHGGRGLPPIADDLGRLHQRYGGTLIVAHAGIVDLAAMARNFAGVEGVVFDTSVLSVLDLLDLYRLVPPEQVVYASDYPYGRQPQSLLIALRAARMVGLDDDAVRAMLGGIGAAIADGRSLPTPTSPVGAPDVRVPVTLARIHQYLTLASGMVLLRHPADAYGALGLALNACDEQADGHRETLERIRELLLLARDVWHTIGDLEDAERMHAARTAFRLMHLANSLALTDA